MPYATVQDVRDRYADNVANATDAQLTALLDDAHANLSVALPDLKTRADNDTELHNASKALVCRAVVRAISNPLDVSQQSVGGMGVTFRSAGLYFTDRELERLAPSATNASDYARSVRLTSPFM